jgi:hypothetical protein
MLKIEYLAKLFKSNFGVHGLGELIKIYFQIKVLTE